MIGFYSKNTIIVHTDSQGRYIQSFKKSSKAWQELCDNHVSKSNMTRSLRKHGKYKLANGLGFLLKDVVW